MVVEEVTYLDTHDDASIALWKIYSDSTVNHKHLFLTHGTFSNRKICLGFARHLARQGYTCWIMEWRNHGHSPKLKKSFNFETVALFDVDAAFDYLFNIQKISTIQCVTHSGGGICLTMFLIQNQHYISNIGSIVMFSCQAFSACTSWVTKYRIWLGDKANKLLTYVPGKLLGLGPENESYFTMKQWYEWNLKNKFTGADGFDYRGKMHFIKIPIFSICATGDTMIAPPEACREYLSAFQNDADNKLLVCSTGKGFSGNYNHHSVMQSSTARKEIWPEAIKWLQAGE